MFFISGLASYKSIFLNLFVALVTRTLLKLKPFLNIIIKIVIFLTILPKKQIN